MLKQCLLQDGKMALEYKLLVFNNLRNALIFCVFASEGVFVRKYSLIFGGRTENSDEKTQYVKGIEKLQSGVLSTETV